MRLRYLILGVGCAVMAGLVCNVGNGGFEKVSKEDASRISGGQVIQICGFNIVTTGVNCRATVWVQGKGWESCNEAIPEWRFGNQKGKWYGLTSRGCVTTGCSAYCGWYTPTGTTGYDCSQTGS